MKRSNLLLLFLITTLKPAIGQILNADFEFWEPAGQLERPTHWDCNTLFEPIVQYGACGQLKLGETNYAVKMDNSLPCVDLDDTSQGKSLGNGQLSQVFKVPSSTFVLSYDLIVDSVDLPAAFIVRVGQSGSPVILNFEQSKIYNGRKSHTISIDPEIESLWIEFKTEGYEKEMAEHACDLGYISAIIDNIKTESVVAVNDINLENIKIYPNPSSGRITIEQVAAQIKKVEIIDIMGRVLLSQKNESHDLIQLDIDDYHGLVFIKIIDKNGTVSVSSLINHKSKF